MNNETWWPMYLGVLNLYLGSSVPYNDILIRYYCKIMSLCRWCGKKGNLFCLLPFKQHIQCMDNGRTCIYIDDCSLVFPDVVHHRHRGMCGKIDWEILLVKLKMHICLYANHIPFGNITLTVN